MEITMTTSKHWKRTCTNTRKGVRNTQKTKNMQQRQHSLVLRDRLRPFADCMLGKLSREHQTNSRLDLAAAQGGLLVVGGKLSGLGGNALKDIVDEGVHHGHALLGDTSVGVDLLQDLVDVRGVRLSSLLGLGGSTGFLGGGSFLQHRGEATR